VLQGGVRVREPHRERHRLEREPGARSNRLSFPGGEDVPARPDLHLMDRTAHRGDHSVGLGPDGPELLPVPLLGNVVLPLRDLFDHAEEPVAELAADLAQHPVSSRSKRRRQFSRLASSAVAAR
jgi:hypothetical protein